MSDAIEKVTLLLPIEWNILLLFRLFSLTGNVITLLVDPNPTPLSLYQQILFLDHVVLQINRVQQLPILPSLRCLIVTFSKIGGVTEKEQILSLQMNVSHSSQLIDSNMLLKELQMKF